MSKKSNTREFVARAKKIHGDRYDYSKVEYVDNHTKVCIICKKHGEFWQPPKNHLKGYGCEKCAREITGKKNSYGYEGFIERARNVHGNKYDYSKVVFNTCEDKVCIICPEHGEFWQTPIAHINQKGGCPKCGRENVERSRRDTTEIFIEKSKSLYGEQFDYSETVYVNSRTPLKLICKQHGEIIILPHTHLHQYGCPLCNQEKNKKKKEEKRKSQIINIKKNIEEKNKIFSEEFFKNVKKIHNEKYSYPEQIISSLKSKITVICPIHGVFEQIAGNHKRGCGCPSCARENLKERFRMSQEEFIKRASEIHNGKYDYTKVRYVNNHTPITIVCPTHGEFVQMPSMHLNERQGCPLCGTLSSKGELEIVDFLKEHLPNIIIEQRNKKILHGKELDIYIPSLKIAIEYDGLRWHSELYNKNKRAHIEKTLKCLEQGILLIHIFEDEWAHKSEIVKSKILNILGLNTNLEKIYARKCNISKITKKISDAFLEQNHIQGAQSATVYLGCFYKEKLVGVMNFTKDKNGYILNRFATDNNINGIGIGGKLFSHFVKNYQPEFVTTYSDIRWGIKDENLYTKIGFKQDAVLPPNYSYVTTKNSFRCRYHKFNFRKNALHRKYGLPLTMTEKEMAEKLGYYKIWDCGLIRYIWKNENNNISL